MVLFIEYRNCWVTSSIIRPTLFWGWRNVALWSSSTPNRTPHRRQTNAKIVTWYMADSHYRTLSKQLPPAIVRIPTESRRRSVGMTKELIGHEMRPRGSGGGDSVGEGRWAFGQWSEWLRSKRWRMAQSSKIREKPGPLAFINLTNQTSR